MGNGELMVFSTCAPVGFFLLLSPWTPDITDLLVPAWGMIWILLCLLPAIVSLTRRRLHVAVYAAGLIALKGEQSFITRWDQIEKFWKIVSIGHAGMPVTFGPITLSLQGVALDQGRKVLPWSECIGINIAWNFRGGAVLIGKRGKKRAWSVISFADIPDLGLFQALVNQLNRNYTP
jgi:hypothetical protein